MVRELFHTCYSVLARKKFFLHGYSSTRSLFENVNRIIRKIQFIKKKTLEYQLSFIYGVAKVFIFFAYLEYLFAL